MDKNDNMHFQDRSELTNIMRILFVTNKSAYFGTPFGGAESSIKLLAQELANSGHKVFYITRAWKKYFGIELKKTNFDGVIVYSFGFFESINKGVVYRIGKKIFSSMLAFLIKKNNIQLVYCFYELNILDILINIRNESLNFKIVMRMSGLYWYEACKKNESLIIKYEDIFNQVDSVNYIHSSLRKMVNDKFILLGMNVRFRHSFNGDIGTSAPFGLYEKYNPFRNDVFVLLAATRFSDYQKRQDILVRAMARIPKSIPIILYLVGSGERKKEITSLIRALNVSNRIICEPYLKQQKLWQKMQQADLLCHPCEYEGLGKVIIESMTIGLPVLVSNVAPLNEYINDGENGFLVNNDPELWAKKITDIYNNKSALISISKNAVVYVNQNHDPKKNVKVYEINFKEIMNL